MCIGAKLTRGGLVMANYICQLDWATSSTLFLGVFVRVIPEELRI